LSVTGVLLIDSQLCVTGCCQNETA